MLVSITLSAMIGGLCSCCALTSTPDRPRWKFLFVKGAVGTLHFLAHIFVMFALGLLLILWHNAITPTIKKQVDEIWQQRDKQEGIVRNVIQETLEPISPQAVQQRNIIQRERQAGETGQRYIAPGMSRCRR